MELNLKPKLTKDLEEEFKIRDEKELIKSNPLIDNLSEPPKEDEDIIQFFDKYDLAKQYIERFPLYYDESGIWWIWKIKQWVRTDDVEILNMIKGTSQANVTKTSERAEILNALKQVARLQRPKEIEKEWIQFNDEIIDLKTGKRFRATSDYFVTNPIPYDLGKISDTPTMDKVFTEWVGEENIQTLYEIIAYCLIPDYPINRLFCFIGGGMNGKSCFLNLLRKFIGGENVCSTELDTLLNSRFEITRLHKKLICMMGETNFNEMSKTSILKKLTGGDLVGFEYKNKNPFEEINYAKIIIATNNLPTTTDKTIGFYRRWLIVDFPNIFSEKKDILSEIPEVEYENLAMKSIEILYQLLRKREFHNEGSVEERIKRFEDRSNPLDKFWSDNIIEDYSEHIFKFDFKKKLLGWLKENKFRELSERAIAKFMKEKGIETKQIQADWYTNENKRPILRAWVGIKWN